MSVLRLYRSAALCVSLHRPHFRSMTFSVLQESEAVKPCGVLLVIIASFAVFGRCCMFLHSVVMEIGGEGREEVKIVSPLASLQV